MATTIRVWGEGRKQLWTTAGKVDVPDAFIEIETGDAYVTRQVKEHSDVVYVRMKRDRRFSSAVGLLAPKDAVATAKALAKATLEARMAARAKRAKQQAAAVLAVYPKMPLAEAVAVARGDVSSRAKIHLAVRAHIRDVHAGFDKLVERYGKKEARERAQKKIDVLVKRWRGSAD